MQGLENSILHGTAYSSQILREILRETANELNDRKQWRRLYPMLFLP